MKGKSLKNKIILLILILLMVAGTVIGIVWKSKKTSQKKPVNPQVEQENEENERPETELLLGFENYEEIVGTKIRFMNNFGATSINVDTQFITEGEGSWLVKPQGSYPDPHLYPTVQLACVDSAFKTNSFASYDKVMLDVYNNSDEEVTLRWTFTMNNGLGATADAHQEFVLAPGAWTTCEYDLTQEEYAYYYVLDFVKYMKLTFLRVKEDKTDTVPDIYIDNLRGHYSEAEHTSNELEYSFSEGITFETASDRYIFEDKGSSTYDSVDRYMPLARIAYADTKIKPLDENFGDYAMVGNATNRTYPAFTMRYDKLYGKGDTLKFMMYVEVDPAKAEGKTYNVEAKDGLTGKVFYSAFPGSFEANKWVEVYIPLNEFIDNMYLFINFNDKNNVDENHRMFGIETPVAVYFDNFIMEKTIERVQKQSDGSVKLVNPYGERSLKLDLLAEDYGGFDKDDYLVFDFECNLDQKMTMWVLGDNQWGPGYETVPSLKQGEKQTVQIKLLDNWKLIRLHIRCDGTTNYKDYEVTISNIYVKRYEFDKYDFTKGVSFEQKGERDLIQDKDSSTFGSEDRYMPITRLKYADTTIKPLNDTFGDYVLSGDATGRNYPAFILNFDKNYGKGKTLKFMLYVEVDEKKAEGKTFRVEGKDSLMGKVFYSAFPGDLQANRWVEVNIPLSASIKDMYLFLNLNDNANEAEKKRMFGNTTKVTAYFDNFSIVDTVEKVEYKDDGSVILHNPYNERSVKLDLYGKDFGGFYKGEKLIFDFKLNVNEKVTMWVLGDNQWGKGYETVYGITGSEKQTIEVEFLQDWEFVRLHIRYEGNENYKDYITTISQIGVAGSISSDGKITLRNTENRPFVNANLRGEMFGGFDKGETLTFEFEINEKETISMWILGDGSWNSKDKMKVLSDEVVNGKRQITVKFRESYEFVKVYIQYQGTGSYSNHVCILRNIKVSK